MRKKRIATPAEQKNVDKIVPVGGREFKQHVHEKMGADGVPETHVSYEPTKNSGFRKAGAGKGDRPRTMPTKQFCNNYDKIDWSK